MKRRSTKHPPRSTSFSRDDWRRAHPECFVPGCKATAHNGDVIDCHEIVGGADRAKTMNTPHFLMMLCRHHHNLLGSRPSNESLALQLAWKLWNTPEEYDAEAVIRCLYPNCLAAFVDEIKAAVMSEYRKIVREHRNGF